MGYEVGCDCHEAGERRVNLICYFSILGFFFFFFGKGTRQASHLRTDKNLPWDTEKNNFSVSQGKMYSSWEIEKALVRVRTRGATTPTRACTARSNGDGQPPTMGQPSSSRLALAWLTAPKAPTSTRQTMPEQHLLPLTFYFPKEMIKKLKKHFHMEESNPNRSPQRYFKHNKTGRAKKSREVHRTHTIFYIREKKKRLW